MNWKDIILSNWQAKLICLLLAFGLWFYVANEGFQIKEVDDSVPLNTINLDEDLAVVDDLDHVKISVRPSVNLQQDISGEMFDAYVDLEGLGKGTYELPVKIIAGDPTVQVLRVDPATVRLTIDDRAEDSFSVVPRIVGEPGAGYKIGDPQISVESVQVGGAESLVGSIRSVVAEVDINGEQSEIKRSVELKAVNDSGETIRNIYIEPKTVDVTVPISQEADVKTVGIKVMTEGQPESGYFVENLEAEPSTAVLRGSRERLGEIDYIETEAISLSGLDSSTEKNTTLKIPEEMELEGDNEVLVKISLGGNQVSKQVAGLFEFKNLGDGLDLGSFTPSNASVTISGSASQVNSLTENDVRVIVDLAGKGQGSYTVNLSSGNVRVPDDIAVVSLDTNKIEIQIN